MSLSATRWAWDLAIKQGPKFVLLALADFSDDEGVCYPSYKLLQQRCQIARSTVAAHLHWLVDNGFIFIQHQHDRNGYRRSNLYRSGIV